MVTQLKPRTFRTTRSKFIEYRKTQKLSKPDDWLKEIESLDKKISKSA